MTPPPARSVLDTIGRTPLVRVNRLVDAPAAALWAKVEFVNPAGSIKDRIALRMVEAAEARGELGPGSTIVDATSGNTGAGLALVAAVRGYRAVFVCSDKVSREKTAVLEAYGAEVIRTPSTVPLDDPRSARQTATRLLAEIPGAWSSQQYENPDNPGAHFDTTGPEVWEQTSGTVTHLVANVGTGGTISGTGRFLKEVSDGRVEVIGADPVGSAYSGPVTPYLVEGAGRVYPNPEDWPTTYHREIVDRFVQVSDHDSFAAARDAARKEGLLVGPSSGTVLAAAARLAAELPPDRVVVALLTDSGRAYLSKLFDDEWLTDHDLGALVTRTGAGLPGARGGPCAQVATVARRSGDGSSPTA